MIVKVWGRRALVRRKVRGEPTLSAIMGRSPSLLIDSIPFAKLITKLSPS